MQLRSVCHIALPFFHPYYCNTYLHPIRSYRRCRPVVLAIAPSSVILLPLSDTFHRLDGKLILRRRTKKATKRETQTMDLTKVMDSFFFTAEKYLPIILLFVYFMSIGTPGGGCFSVKVRMGDIAWKKMYKKKRISHLPRVSTCRRKKVPGIHIFETGSTERIDCY